MEPITTRFKIIKVIVHRFCVGCYAARVSTQFDPRGASIGKAGRGSMKRQREAGIILMKAEGRVKLGAFA